MTPQAAAAVQAKPDKNLTGCCRGASRGAPGRWKGAARA